jgi:pectate lyase
MRRERLPICILLLGLAACAGRETTSAAGGSGGSSGAAGAPGGTAGEAGAAGHAAGGASPEGGGGDGGAVSVAGRGGDGGGGGGVTGDGGIDGGAIAGAGGSLGGGPSGGAGEGGRGGDPAGCGEAAARGSAGAAPGCGGAGASGHGGGAAGIGGGGGRGGTGGAAGAFVGSCPTALVGWGTIAGDGVSTITGGGNATPVRPTTAAELTALAADATPRVIEIAGTFTVPRLQIASNKTLVGVGANATINGGLRVRGYADDMVANVIIKNLHVNGGMTAVDNDAVQLYFAHHIWIDHCDIWDGPDGNLDMTHAVNWVTVSWTKFRYTTAYVKPSGEDDPHRYASLLGHSDNNADEDTGRIKVTFHHNWWGELVIERMPRVRFGQVHVFNNYFAAPGNNYCVRAGKGAALLVEGNYFDHVKSPHQFNSAEDEATASITARDNVYDGTTGLMETGGGGPAFTRPGYSATVEPAAGVPPLVKACAGPR